MPIRHRASRSGRSREASRRRSVPLRALSGAVVAAFSALTLIAAVPASAATLDATTTSFEIDGDKVVAAGVDWDAVLDGGAATGAYVTASGHQSTGILGSSFSFDSGATADGCSIGTDDTVFSGGAKMDDPVWEVDAAPEPNPKGDACSGASAYEIVDIGGEDHVILYQYWTRFQGLGDVTTYQLLEGTDDSTRADDYLIEFDYQSSDGQTLVGVLAWNGDSWQPAGTALDFETAIGTNVDTPATGRDATFGELAIDLTAAGLFDPEVCDAFTVSGFITRTGNSTQASTEDVLLYDDPLTVTDCGALTVEKRSVPAGVITDDIFEYAVLTDGGSGQGSRMASASGTWGATGTTTAPIGVGDLHTWDAVPARQYTLDETVVPSPWAHTSTVCTVTNPSTGVVETSGGDSFPVYPGATTACIITNTLQEASLWVTKSVEGAPDGQEWAFDVTLDPAPAGQAATKPVTSDEPRVGWEHLVVGEVYTVQESVPAEWTGGALDCPGLEDADAEAAGFQFLATAGLVLDCTLTNRADPAGSSVTKTVVSTEKADDGTWVITYAVIATNLSEVFPLVYDLADAPDYGDGIVIESARASGPARSLASSWTPGGLLADDLVLAPGGSHEYTVTVTATVPRTTFAAGGDECPTEGAAGGGFLNRALLTADGEEHEAASCSEPEPPVVDSPGAEAPAEEPQGPVLAATGAGVPAIWPALALLAVGTAFAAAAHRRSRARAGV